VVVLIELTNGRLYYNVLLGVDDNGWLSVVAGKSPTTVVCAAAAEFDVLLITCDFGNEVGHGHFNVKFDGVGERVKLDIPIILLVRVGTRYDYGRAIARKWGLTYTAPFLSDISPMIKASMVKETITILTLNCTSLSYLVNPCETRRAFTTLIKYQFSAASMSRMMIFSILSQTALIAIYLRFY
jgi:hypothetical protein